jgi:STE24 endopeptidase
VNEDRASRYHRLQRWTSVASLLLTAALLASLLLSGASLRLREAAALLAGGGPSGATTVAVYVFVLACVTEVLALPVALYRGFLLERRYGLSRESLRTWALDHIKASVLGVALGIAAAEIVYLALRGWPRGWWLLSAVALTGAVWILTRLTPTLLLPMFYRFTPLARDALRDRLQDLSRRAGVPVLGVYEWGMGAKTRRANAALVGSGGTRRILLSDTLLAEYTDDEIEVILAHELAHHVHQDISKALVAEFVLLVAALGMSALALDRWWRPLALAGPDDVAGLPLILLAGGATMVLATPLLNALSRFNERQADRFALRLTGQRDAFTSAMRRLSTQNLAEPRPSRAALWLFHTHPPVEERIRDANP